MEWWQSDDHNGDGGGADGNSGGRREGIRSYRPSYVVVKTGIYSECNWKLMKPFEQESGIN